MLDPDRAMSFLSFVEARHDVWLARQAGLPQPWTDEPIVSTRKFTNVFRLLDPGSQFVLTDLWEPNLDLDVFLMRCFLYRHTNLPEAWRAFASDYAGMPWMRSCLDEMLDFWKSYRADGHQVFSGAYMVYPQSSIPGTDKVESVIRLTQRLFFDEGLGTDFLNMETQEARFSVLRRNKGVADFMAMQILTDFGYSTEFREDDFVVPGPGARKGAAALDSKAKAEDIIPWAVKAIRQLPTVKLPNGRLPSYMDAQNCLCEFSKWVRYSEKPAPGRLYIPAHPGPQPSPVLPEHWL